MKPIVEVTGWKMFMPAKTGDVGHDLFVTLDIEKMGLIDRMVSAIVGKTAVVIWPFTAKLIPTGIKVGQPDDVWCMITARSSAMKKKFMVIGGIIDSGYRGDLFTVLHNFGLRPRLVKEGERYSQVIFFPAVRPKISYVGHLDNTQRGATGFGSSGQ